MKISFYCVLITFLSSCGSTNTNTEKQEENTSKVNLEGYWGNTVYIDEVLNGRIKAQALCPIIWTSVVFEIKNDPLIRIGLTHNFDTLLISKNIDSLATMDGFGTYKLSYNNSDFLQTTALEYKKTTSSCTEITFFKRLRKEEGKKAQELMLKKNNINIVMPF